jgi:hypothetical protein
MLGCNATYSLFPSPMNKAIIAALKIGGRGSISSAMAHGLGNNWYTVDVALAIMGNQVEQGGPLGSSYMGPEVTNG